MGHQLLILAAALVADRATGDPQWLWSRLPHPVVAMGALVGALDRWLNREADTFRTRRLKGVAAIVALGVTAVATGALLHRAFEALPLGSVLEVLAVSVLLAQKSLLDHVRAVAAALAQGGLVAGRRAVARVVGRDVTVLDEAGVSRAAIESLAENFSDGLVAPAFWYALLGLPGIVLFKLVNTADSMIGHRSPRHEAFGWAAARLDDCLNLVPARLSAIAFALAAIPGGTARQALAAAWGDAPHHRSPNAGWPEAAAAGALGIALGGPRRYGELLVDGAWLNPAGRRDATPADIAAALRLAELAWGLSLAAILLIALANWR